MHAAIDAGITFMDNAWEYHEGESEIRMGKAIEDRRDRVFLMTKVCTHGRDAQVAMRQLEESLRRLKTDYLDLWQVHECVYYNDPDAALRARAASSRRSTRAKAQGKVRYVGFTGHKDPEIHLRDAVVRLSVRQLPAAAERLRRDVPQLRAAGAAGAAAASGIAPIGMKSLGGDGKAVKKKAVRVEDALRYAMSLPVATTVSGIDSMRVLKQNLKIAQGFKPMTRSEMAAYRRKAAAFAGDGRFETYKATAEFDGPEGRSAHGFPPPGQLSGIAPRVASSASACYSRARSAAVAPAVSR